MALRIQPEVSTQTCHWHIDAPYTDTSGSHTQRIRRGTDTLATEAIPKQPVQGPSQRARSSLAMATANSGPGLRAP
ncbi:hypothetical protein ACIBCO_32050 [Streptomyces violascens]|uniref:hypothetical protein n=1 Tax=Streptomyces violascens TaxID=67381 RepID=UPI00379325DF